MSYVDSTGFTKDIKIKPSRYVSPGKQHQKSLFRPRVLQYNWHSVNSNKKTGVRQNLPVVNSSTMIPEPREFENCQTPNDQKVILLTCLDWPFRPPILVLMTCPVSAPTPSMTSGSLSCKNTKTKQLKLTEKETVEEN